MFRSIHVPPRRWGLLALLALVAIPAGSPLRAEETKPIPPLQRVPREVVLMLHARGGQVLQSPVGKALIAGLGKDADKIVGQLRTEVGFDLLQVEQFTLFIPSVEEGERIGMLFKMKAPYDAEALKKALVAGEPKQMTPKGKEDAKKEMEKPDPARDGYPIGNAARLHLTSPTTFAILHRSMLKEYLNPKPEAKPGPMAAAFAAAADPAHAGVLAINFAGLPAEVFDENNVFLRPFFPLMKDNRALLTAKVDTRVSAEIRIECKNADTATDALRSWNLLMQLASDGIDFALKDKPTEKELGFAFPAFKAAKSAIQQQKATTEGATLKVALAMPESLEYADLARGIAKLAMGESQGAQAQQSLNNMKQIALALHNYESANGGFPPQAICDKKGKPLLSWRVAILPYLEQNNVYKQFKLDEPWDSAHNLELAKVNIKTFMTPGDPIGELAKTRYRCFFNQGAAFDRLNMTKIADYQDGTSNTLLFVEAAEPVVWTKPDDLEFNPKKDHKALLRKSDDRFTFAFGDGAVRRVKATLPESVLKLLIQKNDGMVIPNFE